jgi:hypothetical protein
MFKRAFVVLAALITPLPVAAQDAGTYHDLLVQYRCPVVDRLEQIYVSGNPASSHGRFLAITVPHAAQAYVQCLFHDNNRKVYCEAASGFYDAGPGAARTFHQPADVITALGRLGFSTDDSAGNFRIDRDLADPPDFNALADFILKALHDGYGARADMTLEFNAPLAPHATSKCVPVS